jgi:signal transduction histidine kinase
MARQRGSLLTLAWLVVAVVVLGSFETHPAPGLSGQSLAVSLVLALYVASVAVIAGPWPSLGRVGLTVTLAAIGGTAVALAALEPSGTSVLAASIAVWIAALRLPVLVAGAIVVPVTAGLAVALAAAGDQGTDVLSSVLLCVLLVLVAVFVRQAQTNEDRTEALLSELEDARDAQARAAAASEREHIARELHDVLAHSLSGLSIQLEAARLLAAREQVSEQLQRTIVHSGELAREGLVDARRAVGALRGTERPVAEQLQTLVETCRRDLDIEASLTIEGTVRDLDPAANLALYRGVQESLTNVARYAPGSRAAVVVRYETQRTLLTVDNADPDPRVQRSPVDPGGGHGLAGMRERAATVGGRMQAGPTDHGWRVSLELPA